MLKKTLLLFLLAMFIPLNAKAYSDYIIASGENIGIEVKSDGIIVVGTYKVNDVDIVSKSDIKVGDIIKSVDDDIITSVNDLITKIESINDNTIKLGYVRNNILKYTNLKLEKVNNNYKTGLYVKDSISGVGTLTFIDPKTKIFGALGHEIVEKNTGRILESKEGTIYDSEVTGIIKSSINTPGEKNARYYSDKVNGNIYENTNKGIFGNYIGSFNSDRLYKVAQPNEIKKGSAKILTVLKGTEVNEYDIEITKISSLGSTKNIVFKVTDKELLKRTGGIIQGMSGSPIIQGDKIVGAVTHVIVDNPEKGYGIFITNMLEEAEN